jgi:hypothetical protein
MIWFAKPNSLAVADAYGYIRRNTVSGRMLRSRWGRSARIEKVSVVHKSSELFEPPFFIASRIRTTVDDILLITVG